MHNQDSPVSVKSLWLPTLLSLSLTAGCFMRIQMEGFSGLALYAGVFALFLIGFPYILLLTSPTIHLLAQQARKKALFVFLAPAYIIASYLIYSLGTASFKITHLLAISLYATLPCLFLYGARRKPGTLCINDILFIIAIWIPIDSAMIQEVWPWPSGIAKNVYTIPMAVTLVCFAVLGLRGLEGLTFRWPNSLSDWKITAGCFFGFLAIGMPLGFLTEFIAYNPKNSGFGGVLLSCVLTFLLVAVPEEVLFRGIIQNHLQKILKKPVYGLMIASVVFGVSHFNNGPTPDWRYVFIASIAGVFYGLSYNKSKSLIPAILVHTAVDVVWIEYFYK